jgi:multidrug efflux system outer membrane protein
MTNGWIAIQKSLGLGWVELSRDNRTSVEPAPVDRKSVMKPEQS